jgi:hypothetical protein
MLTFQLQYVIHVIARYLAVQIVLIIILLLYVIYVLLDGICLMVHVILHVLLDIIIILCKVYAVDVLILVWNAMLM